METKSTNKSRLFNTTSVETRDDLEEKLERYYQHLLVLTAGLSDKDAHEALNKALLKEKGYEEVSLGLLVAILTEPHNAPRNYHHLTLISHDGFNLVLSNLSQMVLDRYLRFTDVAKAQVLWLLREMIKNAVNNVDNLLWNLMRHAAGGDVSPKNITLIEGLLDVLSDYRPWLDKFPMLIASVTYTYLRLIEDHTSPYLSNLRQKEVNFLIGLIRDRFNDVCGIGRDLVRLLQNVARIPEFEQLWRDILGQPKSLSPSFAGVHQLLQARTSRRYLQSRLTPDMERKLVFFTSQVRFGNHKRYQDWFQRQYLATPESQSLRCDIIRFIVGVIHPTNELLCSDIIPRWAVIGWLLTTCTSSVAVSNAKLALFYDWLFFDSEKDNIMNIEPAILVMHHSMRSHPAVTATLLDFLCRIIPNFYVPLTDKVRAGIFNSLRQILDKKVVPSLAPLFDNSKLDPELRSMVRETFKEFCNNSTLAVGGGMAGAVTPTSESSSRSFDFVNNAGHSKIEDGGGGGSGGSGDNTPPTPEAAAARLNNVINNHILGTDEPAFSDDEEDDQTPIIPRCNALDDDSDGGGGGSATAGAGGGGGGGGREDDDEEDEDDDDIPLAKVRLKEKTQDKLDDSVEGPIGDTLSKMQQETKREKRYNLMEQLVKQLTVYESDDETLPVIARTLCACLKDDFKEDRSILPDIINDQTLLDSVNRSSPLFVLYKTLYNFSNSPNKDSSSGGKKDSSSNSSGGGGGISGNVALKECLFKLVSEMRAYLPRVGFLLLYFLKVQNRTRENKKEDQTKASALKISVYKEYCHYSDKKIDSCLYEDLVACHVSDTKLVMWLVPDLFRDFKQQTINNAQIIRVILSAIDSRQLQTLVGKVLQGHLVMFKSDNILPLLKISLDWESIEQFFFWQLVHAHDISIDTVLPLVTQLDYERHSEALTAITLMLKQEKPNADYVKYLFSRDICDTGDLFVFTIVKYWCDEYIDKVAELISALLSTRYPSTSPNKRKRTGGGSTGASKSSLLSTTVPSADQVLGHLEQLRIICERHDCMAIYTLDSMQRALNIALNNSSDGQKKLFGQLFALLEDDEDDLPASATTKSSSRHHHHHHGNHGSSQQQQQQHYQGRGGRKQQSSATLSGSGGGGGGSGAGTTGGGGSSGTTAGGSSGSTGGGSSSKGGSSGGGGGSSSHHHKDHHHHHQSNKRGASVSVRDLIDSSQDSSEEEEIVKPKQPKKRKKVVSDSD